MIIELETGQGEVACHEINRLYELAIANGGGSVYSRNVLKKCFECGWEEIKEKMEVEGSCWYVWYMDGVRNYIIRHFKNRYK